MLGLAAKEIYEKNTIYVNFLAKVFLNALSQKNHLETYSKPFLCKFAFVNSLMTAYNHEHIVSF